MEEKNSTNTLGMLCKTKKSTNQSCYALYSSSPFLMGKKKNTLNQKKQSKRRENVSIKNSILFLLSFQDTKIVFLISLPKNNTSNGICSSQHLAIESMFHLRFLDSYLPANMYSSLLRMIWAVGDICFGFFYYVSEKIRYSKKLLAVVYGFGEK